MTRERPNVYTRNEGMGKGGGGVMRVLSAGATDKNWLTTFEGLSRRLAAATDLHSMAATLLSSCAQLLSADTGSVFILDKATGELVLMAASGDPAPHHLGNRVAVGEAVSGDVVSTGKPLLVSNISNHPPLSERRHGKRALPSFACIPLRSGDKIVGVLNLASGKRGAFAGEAEAFASALGAHAGLAFERMMLHEEVVSCNVGLHRRVEEATAELIKKNEELKTVSDYTRNILSSIAEGLVVVDRDMRVITWNPTMEQAFQIAAGNAEGRELTGLFPSWEERKIFDTVRSVLEDGVPQRLEEVNAVGPGSSPRTLEISVSPLRGADGSVDGAILVVQDVTTQAEMRRQLTLSERLAFIGTLVAGVAHEINNPLDGAMRYTNLALKTLPGEEPARDYLLKAGEGLSRMAKIVASLLEFAGQTPRPLEPTNVNDAVEDALLFLEHKAQASNIEVVSQLNPELPTILDGELYQVFTNLIKNAIDAMPGGGRLTVSTDYSDNYIEVRISDTGCGINPEIRDRIFDPFFTTKEVGAGTGLGLTISYGIVEKYNGTIAVSSDVGVGTTFTVRLPIEAPEVEK